MKEMTSSAQNGRTQDAKRELSLDYGMKDKCSFFGPYATEGAQKGVRHLLYTFLSWGKMAALQIEGRLVIIVEQK